MDRRIDLLGSLGVVVLGVVVLVTALNYPLLSVEFDAVGPMGFPIGVAVVFMVGGAIQATVTGLRLRRSGRFGTAEGTPDDDGSPGSFVRVLGMILGFAAYLLLMRSVGYLVLTPAFMAAALYAMGYRQAWKVAAVALGFTVVSFALFDGVLNVPLPTGVLTELLAQAGLIGRIR